MPSTPLRSAALLALAAAAAAGVISCSGRRPEPPALPSAALAARCQSPRPGTSDQAGTAADEKAWLRAWTDDLYLWYHEVPPSDPAAYATPQDYFSVLKTPAVTASGRPRDQFHFYRSTAEWQALSQASAEVGYGLQLVLRSSAPPRSIVVAYREPGSPADAAGIDRGAELLAVDGVPVVDGDKDALNAGLFPARAGESHTLTVQDAAATGARAVMMVSAVVTGTPVRSAVLTSPAGRKVGYVLMNDHLQAAEGALATAISQLRAAVVEDLVLDLRYNGGGYLLVASQTAYMVAGGTRTANQVFERTVFNDKYPGTDPVTGDSVSMPFYRFRWFSAQGGGAPLPTLSLPRLFVLTGPGTCSASESVLNGLAGVDLPVYQIGAATCGKPYGFYPQDNCGTTWFSIQFQGVNAKGFGDYADGFTPGGSGDAALAGCAVADDFRHALGDPAEERLAAALAYLDTGVCPALPAAQAARALRAAATERDWQLPRSPARQNRFLLPR